MLIRSWKNDPPCCSAWGVPLDLQKWDEIRLPSRKFANPVPLRKRLPDNVRRVSTQDNESFVRLVASSCESLLFPCPVLVLIILLTVGCLHERD